MILPGNDEEKLLRSVALQNAQAVLLARERTERELIQANQRITDILESIADGFIALDREWRIIFVNRQAAEILRPLKSRENLMGANHWEAFPETVGTVLEENYRRAMREQTAIYFENFYPPLDAWFDIRAYPSSEFLSVYFQDVTQRKKTEAALRASETRTQAIFQASLDGIVTIDHLGQIMEFNKAAELIFGYPRAQVLGKELAEVIIPPSLREQHRHGLKHYLLTGQEKVLGKRMETTAMHSDGSEFPVELAITRLDAEGPAIFTGFIRDISERKRVERELHFQHVISRVLADASSPERSIPEILQVICCVLEWDLGELWTIDPREGVLRCTETWSDPDIPLEAFKMTSRQLSFARNVGLPGRVWASRQPAWVSDILADENFQRGPAARQVGLRGAFAFPILSGSIFIGVIDIFSREVREPEPGFLELFAILGSQLGQFLQRRRLEAQLVQSQKMDTVGKLAGGVAHEFNGILTAIIGRSELLLRDLPPGSSQASHVTEISNAADRAAILTRQLLAYGRKQILQPEILDLNSILAGMEGTLNHLIGRAADVRIAPASGLKTVKADAGQIEQVIMNLALNAVDAMPNGGKLTLETANVTFDTEQIIRFPEMKAGEYVMLAFTDTGIGMTEEVKAHVFEPFFSTKGFGQGAGLGMSTCFGIIKQSGGHISVESAPSQGTAFKIYLPQAAPELRDTPLPASPLDLPGGTETILLVEDDPTLAEMAGALLRRLGYTVLSAAGSLEALILTQQPGFESYDLLFANAVLQPTSGKELADRLQTLFPHTRSLLTSPPGVRPHGVPFLQKPYTPSALANKVREVLDLPAAGESQGEPKLQQNYLKALAD